jgi:hypothetical protein
VTKPRPAEPADLDSVADRLLRITAALAIAGASLILVGGLVDYFLFNEAIEDLNPKLEGNLLSWLSVVAVFGAALAAALHALTLPGRRHQFAALAPIFALLSLDDMIQIHERVADHLEPLFFEHIETVIFLPVFAAAFLIVWALALKVPPRAGRFLRLAMMLLVAAVVVDLGATMTMNLEAEGTAWPHAVRIAIEEALELSGWILVSATLTTVVCLALLEYGALLKDGPGTGWSTSGGRRRSNGRAERQVRTPAAPISDASSSPSRSG